MIEIILLFFVGIGIGLLIRKFTFWIKRIEVLTNWSVYLLLFLLGLSVGKNEVIFNNLNSLGINALLITFGGVAGSLAFSWLLSRFVLKSKVENQAL